MSKDIVAPLLSEKSLGQVENFNIYTFFALAGQTKLDSFMVRSFVETKYKVKVVSVNSQKRLGKTKRFGAKRNEVKRRDASIFFVKLAKNDKISEFKLDTKDIKEN